MNRIESINKDAFLLFFFLISLLRNNQLNKMNTFLPKVLKYISQEGLIFFSKFNDLYSHDKLSYNAWVLLYDILSSKESELARSPFTRNYYALCLYYLTEQDSKYSQIFHQYFSPVKLQVSPNQPHDLNLVYNIIEYEDKYHIFTPEELTQLGLLLSKFNAMEKEFEMFLLYDYYCSLLHLYRGDVKKSLHSSFMIIQNICEFSEQNAPSEFAKFIELKNSVLNARINQMSMEVDMNELSVIYSNLLGNMKTIDRKVSLKLGLKLFDLYRERNKYSDCLTVLKQTYKLLQCDLMKGNKIEYCSEFMLNIATKMAYTSLLLNDQNSFVGALKKLQKYLGIMGKTQSQELLNEYGAYLVFYQQSLEYTGSNQKNSQVLNYFREKYNKLVEIPDEAIINLYAMNNSDPVVAQYHKLVESNKAKMENKLVIPQKMLISTLLSIYNYISNLTKSIIYDPNETKHAQYLKQMSSYSQIVLDYISFYHDSLDVLQLDYVKETIIKIAFGNICTFYYQNNSQEVLNRVTQFENTAQLYWKSNQEAFTPFAVILKLKGDAYMRLGAYKEAKDCYLKCEMLRRGNDKHLAVIRANLGICFMFLKDKKTGFEYLNMSLDAYNNLNKANNSPIYQEKYAIINKVVSAMNSN